MIFAVIIAIASIVSRDGAPAHQAGPPPKAAARPVAERNPSPYQAKQLPVGNFEKVTISGPFKVGVVVDDEPTRLTVQGPPALLADTIATVEGDTLIIRFREGAGWSWNPGSGVNIVVSTPKLSAIRIEGAADVDIFGVRGDSFSAATDGSGNIRAHGLKVGHLQLATAGAGGITVEGSARDGTYVVAGSGSIDAKRLTVANALISIAGAGAIYADVTQLANISINGSGQAEIVGGASCINRPADSPRITCR